MLLTLDVPYLGRRLNEFRNDFGVPQGMEYPNLFPGVDVTNLEDGDDSMAYGIDLLHHLKGIIFTFFTVANMDIKTTLWSGAT